MLLFMRIGVGLLWFVAVAVAVVVVVAVTFLELCWSLS